MADVAGDVPRVEATQTTLPDLVNILTDRLGITVDGAIVFPDHVGCLKGV